MPEVFSEVFLFWIDWNFNKSQNVYPLGSQFRCSTQSCLPQSQPVLVWPSLHPRTGEPSCTGRLFKSSLYVAFFCLVPGVPVSATKETVLPPLLSKTVMLLSALFLRDSLKVTPGRKQELNMSFFHIFIIFQEPDIILVYMLSKFMKTTHIFGPVLWSFTVKGQLQNQFLHYNQKQNKYF